MAYEEEGMDIPEIDEDRNGVIQLYPRSVVDKIINLNLNMKKYDYNFIGCVFFSKHFKNRKWVLDFAKKKFTEKSLLIITDSQSNSRRYKNYMEKEENKNIKGSFNKTENQEKLWGPFKAKKEDIDVDSFRSSIYFDENYYRVMSESKFTLCPGGDRPWSMRFFEACLCKSIPIVKHKDHTGRNDIEKNIPFKFYYVNDDHVYKEEWVEYNFKLFMKYNTLIDVNK